MLRAVLPATIGVVMIFVLGAFLAASVIHPGVGAFAALVVGFAGAYLVWKLPTESILWDKGAEGERKTAQALEPLTERGFVLLHDRRIPGGRGNIDHVAIGPSGVYVIETKNLSGKIEITFDTLFVSEHERQWYVDEVYREAIAVQISLGDLLNPIRVTVTPVLCVHGPGARALNRAVSGVRLLSAEELRKVAVSSNPLLDAEQVQQLARAADKRLRAMYSWEP